MRPYITALFQERFLAGLKRTPARTSLSLRPTLLLFAVALIESFLPGLAQRTLPETESLPQTPVAVQAPAAMRSTTISWGGFRSNEQFIGAENKWPFVQKYMDGFLLHGGYWASARTPHDQFVKAARALGAAMIKNNKTACIETGWEESSQYNQTDDNKRMAHVIAQRDIAKIRELDQYGVKVSKIRVDWFPLSIMGQYASIYQTTNIKDLLLMVTGADKFWGSMPGFDPRLANWREYTSMLNDAFPHIEFSFDQAPCNFLKVEDDPAIRRLVSWPGFGYGYSKAALTNQSKTTTFKVQGKAVPINLDFADLMNSVALSSRALGLNYYGFECDTPYSEFMQKDGKLGKDLVPFLLAIEHMQHHYKFHSGKIINDAVNSAKITDHDKWDKIYHDRCLQFLEAYQAAGGRADQYILESWYEGPFTYFPETKDGTYSNLVRDAIRRIRGIDDDGHAYNADISIRLKGESQLFGERVCKPNPDEQLFIHQLRKNEEAVTLEVVVRNCGSQMNKGDCRATTLLRASEIKPDGWTVDYVDAESGQNLNSQILCQKGLDGHFVGGLEPEQCKSIYVIVRPTFAGKNGHPQVCDVALRLYWNPQDPKAIVRDAATIRVKI